MLKGKHRTMTDTFPHTDPLDTSITEELRIDLVAEELAVSTKTVEVGQVHINKRVLTEEAELTLQHLDHTVDVERIAVNEIFETAPPSVRTLPDGTVVYSVVREVPVVVTRYELIEEVHVRSVNTAHDEHFVMPVRREQLDITRTPNPQATSKPIRQTEA